MSIDEARVKAVRRLAQKCGWELQVISVDRDRCGLKRWIPEKAPFRTNPGRPQRLGAPNVFQLG